MSRLLPHLNGNLRYHRIWLIAMKSFEICHIPNHKDLWMLRKV